MKVVIFFAITLISSNVLSSPLQLVRSISHERPAFTKILEEDDVSNLYISSFKFMGGDNVKKYVDLENHLNSRSINIETIVDKIIWPNEIEKYPGLINGEEQFVVSSGFFPPTKNTGAVHLFGKASKSLLKVTKDKKGWWYHRTRFWDYDRDGVMDILTARAYKGMVWGKGAEFLVLLAPNEGSRTRWEEKVLFEGPDVFFELVDLDSDGEFEVISSQFLNEKISYHYKNHTNRKWEEKIIDNTIGPGFDLSYVDLNADGKKEILLTNHVSTKKAGVFVYESPKDPRNEDWHRHVIHEGFVTTARGIGQASPGNAKAFNPMGEQVDGKLSIVVSGDGNEKVHLFTPTEEPWKYNHEVIYNGKGIIGKVTAADSDKDGKAEIYIPAYDENKILIFEY
ncbi:MAG: hypothetical protein EP319_04270 [Deltaproteobacteria bacterium]|nr:MAG: hypothetical protein EP319_04270 [Deltaproteobacteria bacterium]